MTRHRRVGIVVILISVFTSLLAAQGFAESVDPFGFAMGQTLTDQVKSANQCQSKKEGIWSCKTAPTPLDGAEFYVIGVTSDGLVHTVKVVSSNFDNDEYGSKVKARYEEIESLLTAKYGKPDKEFDFLLSGSIWDEPKDFAMSLFKEQRTLSKFWKIAGTGVAIMIQAFGSSMSSTYLIVQYQDGALASPALDRKLSDSKAL